LIRKFPVKNKYNINIIKFRNCN